MALTDHGRAHCLRRLSAATSADDLRSIWERLSDSAQADPEVMALKYRREKAFLK